MGAQHPARRSGERHRPESSSYASTELGESDASDEVCCHAIFRVRQERAGEKSDDGDKVGDMLRKGKTLTDGPLRARRWRSGPN